MITLRRFLLRVWNAIAPDRAERELSREVAAHLALIDEEYRRRGFSPDEAARAARRALGGVEASKDRHRDARSFVWLDDLRRDVGYAIRMIRRSPGAPCVAMLTLALAIGATTSIFTVVDHVLLRSLPAPHADRLVRLFESNPALGEPRQDASPPNITNWRQATTTLDVITMIGGTSVTMTGGSEPEAMIGMLVSPEFFDLTGARLELGHPFAPDDYTAMANAALGPMAVRDPVTGDGSIIISHALWHRQFGADPTIVGRRVALNGHSTVIVGVMPADFRFNESSWGAADCWIPLVESRLANLRRFRQFTAIGRLRPGVTVETAQREFSLVAARLAAAYPADDGGWSVGVEPLGESMTTGYRATLWILFGGVACVLLIASANVANLLLMRATGRRREVAIRVAIGAGRSRLIRQWLTESTLVAVAGGLAGFGLSVWAVPALIAFAPPDLPRLGEVAVDGRILGFSVIVSLLAGACCGFAPAIGLGHGVDALRSTTALSAIGKRPWLRASLVVVQVTFAIVLLVGAGLLARTVLAVRALDLGFDPHHVLTFGVNLRGAQYRYLDSIRAFTRDLDAQLARVPGVQAAGVGMVPLLGGVGARFVAEGRADPIDCGLDVPSPGYFTALHFRLQAGRFFTDTDKASGALVAIVNASFARTAWGTVDAVGRRIRQDQTVPAAPEISVVGVVDDIRRASLEAPAPSIVFLPMDQSTIATSSNFVVRTVGDPNDVLPAVRAVVANLDANLAVTRVATMDERVAKLLAPRVFNVWLAGAFSMIALVLAVVGLYGLVSEAVARRTQEIGVRMALGATSATVVRMVVGGSLAITAVGLALGLGASAVVTRSLGSMLFGVTPLDPAILTVTPLMFGCAAGLAAALPARRAARVDPVIALRIE